MRSAHFGLLASIGLVMVGPASTQAATFLLRELDGLAMIAVAGKLEYGDQAKFAAVAVGLSGAVVAFSSPGGNLGAGIEIGKIIRMRKFMTVVPSGHACASACALAWLGGTQRLLFEDSLVGFHAAYSSERGEVQVTSVGNALVGAYLANLGLSETAIGYITSSPPSEMTWLDPRTADLLGIEVTELQMPPASAALAPSAPATAPIRPASPPLSLETRAAAFMRTHWLQVSGDNTSYLTYVGQTYAEMVDYFGTPTTRDEIMRQQRVYVARWPKRTNRGLPDTETVICDQQSARCTIEGEGAFDAVSVGRKKASSGTFTYSFTVSLAGSPPRIERETSTVTSRYQRELVQDGIR